MGGQVVLLAKENFKAPACRIARNAGSVDTATNDQEIVHAPT
jgi:hypothetical protein